MSRKVFTEEQSFTQWWIWVLLIAALAGISAAFYTNYQATTEYILSMTFGYGITVIVMVFIGTMKLKSRIDERGVSFKFWPIFMKEKHFAWQEIEKAEVIQYSPIQDYGGWGYRFTFGNKGKAVNVRGNMGLKLHFKKGKPFLIGTQKAEELKAILKQYHPTKPQA